MKKTILILIFSYLLLNCGQNKGSEKKLLIDKKPIQHFMSYRIAGNKYVEYDIDKLDNFNETLKILDTVDCSFEYAIFKMETDDTIYKIQPLQFCESIFDYKLREVIYINMDTITVNYEIKHPIDSLKIVLKNHLINPNNDRNYSLSNEKKMICINVDSSKNIAHTKELLLKIIKNINELKAKKYATFMFEKRGILQE